MSNSQTWISPARLLVPEASIRAVVVVSGNAWPSIVEAPRASSDDATTDDETDAR